MADRISPSFKRPPDANKPSVDGRAPHFGARPSDTRSANSWPRLKYVMKEAWRARARDSAQTKMGFSMFKRTSPFVAWGYLIFIAYATLSPAHLRPELTASEPPPVVIIEHVGAFGLLGLIFSAAYPHRLGFVCALVLAGAIALELLQFAIPDRDPRVVDAFEKLAGGAIGILAANWLSIKVQRQRKADAIRLTVPPPNP